MDELRTLLRDKADEIYTGHVMPIGLWKRARRRRAGTMLTIGLLIAGLSFGALEGAQWVQEFRSNVKPLPAAPPEGTEFPRVDPLAPPTSPFSVLVRPASHRTVYSADPHPLETAAALIAGAGFEATFETETLTSDVPASAPTSLFVNPKALADARALKHRLFPGAEIVPASGEQYDIRVWLGDDFLEIQEVPLSVYRQIDQFLIARRISDAAASQFLSAQAFSQYERHEGGLSLPSYGAGAFLFSRINSITRDANEFIVVVEFPIPHNQSAFETLRVGYGNPWRGEPQDWLITSAVRNDQNIAPDFVKAGSVGRFVGQFMEARLLGRGAESFLSSIAATQFERRPRDQLSLYSDPEWEYVEFEITSVEPADANSYEVTVVLITSPGPGQQQAGFLNRLFVGPGINVEGSSLPLVIRGVQFEDQPSIDVPPAVAATRDAILAAARARDWEELRALIPEMGFTFSYGGNEDAIAYWQNLERNGEPVLDILATLLQGDPARFREGYSWPAPGVKDPDEWTDEDEAILRAVSTDKEIRQYKEFGSYLGWRVGIEPDGTWIYFVAGD